MGSLVVLLLAERAR